MSRQLEAGARVQYACGHWLTAGSFGIKDVSDIPAKWCGRCQQRLRDAAPEMLEILKGLNRSGMYVDPWKSRAQTLLSSLENR